MAAKIAKVLAAALWDSIHHCFCHLFARPKLHSGTQSILVNIDTAIDSLRRSRKRSRILLNTRASRDIRGQRASRLRSQAGNRGGGKKKKEEWKNWRKARLQEGSADTQIPYLAICEKPNKTWALSKRHGKMRWVGWGRNGNAICGFVMPLPSPHTHSGYSHSKFGRDTVQWRNSLIENIIIWIQKKKQKKSLGTKKPFIWPFSFFKHSLLKVGGRRASLVPLQNFRHV